MTDLVEDAAGGRPERSKALNLTEDSSDCGSSPCEADFVELWSASSEWRASAQCPNQGGLNMCNLYAVNSRESIITAYSGRALVAANFVLYQHWAGRQPGARPPCH